MTSPQAEVGRWHRATFDPCPLTWVGLKLAAEAGELAGVVPPGCLSNQLADGVGKVCQAILTMEGEPRRAGRTYEDLRIEAADTLIVLYAIAERAGFDLGVAFWERFAEVSQRKFLEASG